MRPRLTRLAMRVVGHAEDAEDVVQDTFLRGLRSADTVRDPAAFEGWMCAVAKNVAIDRVRRRSVRYAEMLSEAPIDHRVPGPEVTHAVREIVDRLPAGQRRALTDAAAGYRRASIARRECVSTAAIKTRLSRARATVRAALRP